MTWVKGESGNPSGRPKGRDKVAEIARQIAEDSPELVKAAFKQGLKRSDARMLSLLADRGYGKLKESLDVTVNAGLADKLEAAHKRLAAKDNMSAADVAESSQSVEEQHHE